MKRQFFALAVVLLLALGPLVQIVPDGAVEQASISQTVIERKPTGMTPNTIHLADGLGEFFTENIGQLEHSDVRFYAQGDPLSAGFTPDGVVYTLIESDFEKRTDSSMFPPENRRGVTFSMTFEGCNAVEPKGVGPFGDYSNYLIGSDMDRWVTGAKSYREVLYQDLWDGIDLRFYFRDGMLKYDLMLEAGVDPGVIVFRYGEVEGLEIEPATGDLLIRTPNGVVRDVRPVAFQDAGDLAGGREGRFVIREGDSCGFWVPPSVNKDLPLIIDPGLEFSTFVGGTGNDHGYSVALDKSDNIFFVGNTISSDFPTTDGTLDPVGNVSTTSYDAYIAKFDPSGSTRIFITYIGGRNNDSALDLEVASDGSVFIVGKTESGDFPVSQSAINTTPLGSADCFLLKLSKDGSGILYSTFLGGNGEDIPRCMFVDDGGYVYISGQTMSDDLPVTPGAFCSTNENPNFWHVFAMKIDNSLSNILYCTYLGRTTEGYQDMDVDNFGNAYLVGSTTDEGFPVTQGAYQPVHESGQNDGFVSKLDPTGSQLLNSTFLGGSAQDHINAIEVGPYGSVYLVGTTSSVDFDVTTNAVISSRPGTFASFLVILDQNLSTLEYGTYFGGYDLDYGNALFIEPGTDVVFIAGITNSLNLPISTGAFDTLHRGEWDGFLAGIDLANNRISYCTYFGGEGDDVPTNHGIVMDASGDLLINGLTNSPDFPTTQGAFCNTWSGDYDAFLLRIDPGPCRPPQLAPTGVKTATEVGWVEVSWDLPFTESGRIIDYNVYRGLSPDNVSWIGSGSDANFFIDSHPVNGVENYYRVSANNSAGEGPMSSAVSARPVGTPSAPRGLVATTGDGSVHLSWSPPIGPGGGDLRYRIMRGETRDILENIGDPAADTIYNDSDVQLGEFYYYAVMAFNEYGNSPTSDTVRIKPSDIPSQPREFQVTPGDGHVKLSWNLPLRDGGTMIIGFYVWRMTGSGQMEVIATFDPSHLSFTDTNVTNGRSYTYMVSAYSDVGEGQSTGAFDAIPIGKPGAVVVFKATPGAGNVTLEWDPPLDNGGARIKGYILYWGTESGNLDQQQVLGNTTSFTHRNLDNGVTHYYQIEAENAAGTGPVSIVVHATPMGLPGTVIDLVVEATPSGIKLTWVVPSETGGATSLTYRVLRGTTDDPLNVVGEVVDVFEYVDDTATSGTTYYYRVVAVSTMGEGSLMDPVMIMAGEAPAQVTDVTKTTGNNLVTLTWTAPDDGGSPITQYVILRGIFETGLAEIGRVDGTVLAYTDDTAENGKSYFFKVYAVNGIGAGTRSESVTATPRGPPPAPGVLEAKVKGDNIVLTWIAPTGGNTAPVTGYKIYRGDSELELVLLDEVGNVQSYTDEDVKENKPYYYKVLAVSDSGDGDMSRLADAKIKEEESPALGGVFALLAMLVGMAAFMMRREGESDCPD